MMENKDYTLEKIPAEKFAFAQLDSRIHDTKFETKARGFLADAFLRFSKNKSSVVAAIIILLLLLYAVIAPMVSLYDVQDKDKLYISYPPFIESIANKKLGIFDGTSTYNSINENSVAAWHAIGIETGYEPLVEILETHETTSKWRGQDRIVYTYKVKTNKYYEMGMRYQNFSYEEFDRIGEWQKETGVQVIYPWVEPKDICDLTDNPNIWYQISDSKGTPVYDGDGNFIPVYSQNAEIEGRPYNSTRIAGDDGSYIYSIRKSGSVQCRVCYYNYYKYINGHAPMFIFGTNSMGQDLFTAIGVGARFSMAFAVFVSAINLTIGAIYGAIQGYYGGVIDLLLDRIADILNDVPFIVVAILFQLHLAAKVGVAGAFVFAFILTGWIGMAALTRKQFYRFKSQEFVYAARTLGASDWRLMFQHIFPNSMGTIITSCALVIPSVIRSETTLTYLGIIDLQNVVGTSIGTLMSQGQTSMTTSPHAMFFPAIYFALLMICFNLFGNGLRDAFNPSTRGMED